MEILIVLLVLISVCVYIITRMVQLHKISKAKAERIEVYKFMLHILNRTVPDTTMGFCWLLEEASTYMHVSRNMKDYPELLEHKPKTPYMHGDTITSWWFNPRDHNIRIRILKEIIANN